MKVIEELRFGVQTKQGKVVSFYEHGIHVGMGKTYNFSEVEPIPLTPDELIKLGFRRLKPKSGTQGIYSNGKMNVILSNSGNVYTTKNKLIAYVHTLQNVYYFHLLTGEFLPYKQ